MFERGNLLSADTWISTYVVMNKPCTVYFGLYDIWTSQLDMGFSSIKAKKVPYDYYGERYWMGEFIEDISNFNYSLTVSNLTPFKDYYLQVFAEDLNGNLGDSPIYSNISTNRTFINPIVALVNVIGATSQSANASISLMSILSNSLSIPTSRFEVDPALFPNMSVDLSAAPQYFPSRILTNTTTNTSSTTNTTSNSNSNSNAMNSSNVTTFSIPTAQKNTLIVQILFLPELNDTNALNMFEAFGRLKSSLNAILAAC